MKKVKEGLRGQIDQDIKDITLSKIELDSKKLGEGSFSDIYKAEIKSKSQKKESLSEIAISINKHADKQLSPIMLQAVAEEKHAKKLLTEKNISSPFLHFELYRQPNLTQISALGETDLFTYFGLDKLADKPSDEPVKKFPTAEIKESLAQIILGLETLHKENLVHRDFKLENTLIFLDGNVKIADLATTQAVDDKGRLIWKEATPKASEGSNSSTVVKLTCAYFKSDPTYNPSEYLALDHFSEDRFCLGSLIQDLFPVLDEKDAKPLKILVTELRNSKPSMRPSLLNVKSNEFFGKTDDIRESYFASIAYKYKWQEVDKHPHFMPTSAVENEDVFNLLSGEMQNIRSLYDHLSDQYDEIERIISEKDYDNPLLELMKSFHQGKNRLIKEIQQLKEKQSEIYQEYEKALVPLIQWLNEDCQNLKSKLLEIITESNRIASKGKDSILPRSHSVSLPDKSPKQETKQETNPETNPETKKGPPPLPPTYLLRRNSVLPSSQTFSPQTSLPTNQLNISPPPTPKKPTASSALTVLPTSPVRLPGLGGPINLKPVTVVSPGKTPTHSTSSS